MLHGLSRLLKTLVKILLHLHTIGMQSLCVLALQVVIECVERADHVIWGSGVIEVRTFCKSWVLIGTT